jgi:hypothetical protein
MKTKYTILCGLFLPVALGAGLAWAAKIDSSWLQVTFTSFDLTPPSVLGMIKIDDQVHVAVSLDRNAMEELKQQPAGQKELN